MDFLNKLKASWMNLLISSSEYPKDFNISLLFCPTDGAILGSEIFESLNLGAGAGWVIPLISKKLFLSLIMWMILNQQ